jgi:hypothetical protein
MSGMSGMFLGFYNYKKERSKKFSIDLKNIPDIPDIPDRYNE